MIRVSVIIATRNGRDVLQHTFPNVLAQDFPAGEWEIVVADDGSSDGTADFLLSLTAGHVFQLLRLPAYGKAAALNAAIAAARGEVLLFLDDDVSCPADLVRKHWDAHQRDALVMAYGPIRVASESVESVACDWTRKSASFFDAGVHANPEFGYFCCMTNPNTSVTRELLTIGGPLDESLPRAEDGEYGFRLHRMGYRFLYIPDAAVHEIYRKSPKAVLCVDTPGEAAAEAILTRRYPDWPKSRLHSLLERRTAKAFLRNTLVRCPVSLQIALAPLQACAYALRGVPIFRRAAIRIFEYRKGIIFLRCAVKEFGGWHAYLKQMSQLRRSPDGRLETEECEIKK